MVEPRKPLNNSEMRDLILERIGDEAFKSDRERALFLMGLKLGTLSGRPLEQEEALRMCKMINLFQQTLAPELSKEN